MALADAGPMPAPVGRGIGGARMLSAPMAPPSASGAVAVQAAEASRMRREVNSAADLREAEETMARWNAGAHLGWGPGWWGGGTFRQEDGTWRDAGIRGDAPVVKVAPYSQAWFRLLEALPELRQARHRAADGGAGGARITLELVDGGRGHVAPPAGSGRSWRRSGAGEGCGGAGSSGPVPPCPPPGAFFSGPCGAGPHAQGAGMDGTCGNDGEQADREGKPRTNGRPWMRQRWRRR